MDKLQKASKHDVVRVGKDSFKVVSGTSMKAYDVNLRLSCTCKFASREGIANGRYCSHCLSVLKEVLKLEK